MGQRLITADDRGKRVVSADGADIGMISAVEDRAAYVDPAPGLADRFLARLGWADVDEDHYPIDPAMVDAVTDDVVRLRPAL